MALFEDVIDKQLRKFETFVKDMQRNADRQEDLLDQVKVRRVALAAYLLIRSLTRMTRVLRSYRPLTPALSSRVKRTQRWQSASKLLRISTQLSTCTARFSRIYRKD